MPDSLRAWWARTDPSKLDKETLRSGRVDVFAAVKRLLRAEDRVLDLGCGPGLLARETGRRDIVGVDMSPAMVDAARQWMDEVVPENIFEHHPLDPVDAVVLTNVLEPYPAEVRQVLFRHCADFLSPGGRVIVVLATGGGLGASPAVCSGLDLLFPSSSAGLGAGVAAAPAPDDVEDDLVFAGLDVDSAELLETKTVDHTAALPGEEPRVERRAYALVVARKPRE